MESRGHCRTASSQARRRSEMTGRTDADEDLVGVSTNIKNINTDNNNHLEYRRERVLASGPSSVVSGLTNASCAGEEKYSPHDDT